MAKYILPTNYGGVKYLNDYLLGKLNYGYTLLNFSELVNNADIIEKYYEAKGENSDMLKSYFNLKNVIITLHNYGCPEKDYGSSDYKYIFIKSTNGKYKLEFEKYITYLCILKPQYALIPLEDVNIIFYI